MLAACDTYLWFSGRCCKISLIRLEELITDTIFVFFYPHVTTQRCTVAHFHDSVPVLSVHDELCARLTMFRDSFPEKLDHIAEEESFTLLIRSRDALSNVIVLIFCSEGSEVCAAARSATFSNTSSELAS